MFRIRRIFDDVLPINKSALLEVQRIWREQFSYMSPQVIEKLPAALRDPLEHRLRSFVLVAEKQDKVLGFAVLMHAPDLHFCYLDYISSAASASGRGYGAALYERAREEARLLGAVGLFFECLPDEPGEVSEPQFLVANRARLKFYERLGVRPIANTRYNAPIKPGDQDMPYLLFDDLGSGRPLRRNEARKIVRAILERKYGHLCPPEYNALVVDSFRDDPVQLREPRYAAKARAARPAAQVPTRSSDLEMVFVVSRHHEFHHIRERGYVEAPVRIAALSRELDKLPFLRRTEAKHFGNEHLTAVHDRDFLRYLERACARVKENKSVYPYVFPVRNQTRPPVDWEVCAGYYCIDTFTPITRNAWPAARSAVDCALTAAQSLVQGARLGYALVRPPGHHAERRAFGGFCYLNSAAVAAHFLSRHGSVAMVDVDFHHGNGQQDIFYQRSDVLTVSLHAEPGFAYPFFTGFADERGEGSGLGFNINVPLPEKLEPQAYLQQLGKTLRRVRDFQPRFVVVCLGFDTARGDPTGSWQLQGEHFSNIGQQLGALGVPILVVQEGGYLTRTIGSNARHFCEGLWQASTGRGPVPVARAS